MNTQLVHGIGSRSTKAADAVRPGLAALRSGATPTSNIRTKASLDLCREAWQGTFAQLDSALVTIGNKLHASAGAVESSDNASADQF